MAGSRQAASKFLNAKSINLKKLPQTPASGFLNHSGRTSDLLSDYLSVVCVCLIYSQSPWVHDSRSVRSLFRQYRLESHPPSSLPDASL